MDHHQLNIFIKSARLQRVITSKVFVHDNTILEYSVFSSTYSIVVINNKYLWLLNCIVYGCLMNLCIECIMKYLENDTFHFNLSNRVPTRFKSINDITVHVVPSKHFILYSLNILWEMKTCFLFIVVNKCWYEDWHNYNYPSPKGYDRFGRVVGAS